MTGKLTYIQGDATSPIGPPNEAKYIVHVCNDIGKWGAGFVLAVSKKWPLAKEEYIKAGGLFNNYTLGDVGIIDVGGGIFICNVIGQSGVCPRGGVPPIRWEAVREGLQTIACEISTLAGEASVHMPRIGCGLAGGEWSDVESIIIEELCNRGINVTVYDLV